MDNSTHTWEIDKHFRHMILSQKVVRVFYDFQKYLLDKKAMWFDSFLDAISEREGYSNELNVIQMPRLFLDDMSQSIAMFIDIPFSFGSQIVELNRVAEEFGLTLFIGKSNCDYILPPKEGFTRLNFSFSHDGDMDLETKYIIKK